jgi:hypothetical protein
MNNGKMSGVRTIYYEHVFRAEQPTPSHSQGACLGRVMVTSNGEPRKAELKLFTGAGEFVRVLPKEEAIEAAVMLKRRNPSHAELKAMVETFRKMEAELNTTVFMAMGGAT